MAERGVIIMTYEDLQKWTAELLADPTLVLCGNCQPSADHVEAASRIRALLLRAYEEAAQIAADHRENAINGCGEGGCGDTIASEIRALKDSFTVAPS